MMCTKDLFYQEFVIQGLRDLRSICTEWLKKVGQ